MRNDQARGHPCHKPETPFPVGQGPRPLYCSMKSKNYQKGDEGDRRDRVYPRNIGQIPERSQRQQAHRLHRQEQENHRGCPAQGTRPVGLGRQQEEHKCPKLDKETQNTHAVQGSERPGGRGDTIEGRP